MIFNVNKETVKKFMLDLVTLRTVWIDKGQGKWVVKKRMHPVTRCICACVIITGGFFVYKNFFTRPILNLQTHNVANAAVKPVKNPVNVDINALAQIKPADTKTQPQVQAKREILIPLESSSSPMIAKLPDKIDFGEPDTIITNPEKMLTPNINSDGAYRIYINKSEYTLSLFKGDELIKTYPVAVGRNAGDKQRVGDNRTPEGEFRIVSIENSMSWQHDFRDGKGKIKGAYGPWFLRLDAKGWKGIGIHGTHDPDSVRTMATEGCIRLRNEDLSELKQYAYRNMPVVIREN